MAEEMQFPKRRKFRPVSYGGPGNSHGVPGERREYTDYDASPVMTYRIERSTDGGWGWAFLQHGWVVDSSVRDRQMASFDDAYEDMRSAFYDKVG